MVRLVGCIFHLNGLCQEQGGEASKECHSINSISTPYGVKAIGRECLHCFPASPTWAAVEAQGPHNLKQNYNLI